MQKRNILLLHRNTTNCDFAETQQVATSQKHNTLPLACAYTFTTVFAEDKAETQHTATRLYMCIYFRTSTLLCIYTHYRISERLCMYTLVQAVGCAHTFTILDCAYVFAIILARACTYTRSQTRSDSKYLDLQTRQFPRLLLSDGDSHSLPWKLLWIFGGLPWKTWLKLMGTPVKFCLKSWQS